MAYKVFISHSSVDTWVSEQIELHLQKLGADTFLDERNIEVGDDFEAVITREVKNSDEILILFTPWALERTYIWLEIGMSMILNIRIVPVLHGITIKQFSENTKVPNKLKNADMVELNNIQRYFNEVKTRILNTAK